MRRDLTQRQRICGFVVSLSFLVLAAIVAFTIGYTPPSDAQQKDQAGNTQQQVGRYQIQYGIVGASSPFIIKLDTVTGQTWIRRIEPFAENYEWHVLTQSHSSTYPKSAP